MKLSKQIIGGLAVVIFAAGSLFILARFGDKSNDNPPLAQDDLSEPETSANQIAIIPAENPNTTSSTTTVPATKETMGTTPRTVQPTSPYADGTYFATGNYSSPAGTESIAVSITLRSGVIENVSVTNEANNRTSSRYQNMFISGYKTYVVGKNIADVSIGRVSGSSLTGTGFNSAVARIKNEAST